MLKQVILGCSLFSLLSFSITHTTLFIDKNFGFFEQIVTKPVIRVRSNIFSHTYSPKKDIFGMRNHPTNIYIIFKADEFLNQFRDSLPSSTQTILSYLDWVEIKLYIDISDEYLAEQNNSKENPIILSFLLIDSLAALEKKSTLELLQTVALNFCPLNIDTKHFKKLTISLQTQLRAESELSRDAE